MGPSITTTIRNINTAVIINNSPINTAVIMEELQVRSLESKMIKDDALAWKQLRVTQNMSSLTYKLKAMQPGMNMTCEDPMPSIRSLMLTPYFQDTPYTTKELEY